MKKNIVGLMLKTPEAIQRQLSDAITFIGEKYIHLKPKVEWLALEIRLYLRHNSMPQNIFNQPEIMYYLLSQGERTFQPSGRDLSRRWWGTSKEETSTRLMAFSEQLTLSLNATDMNSRARSYGQKSNWSLTSLLILFLSCSYLRWS